MLVQNSQVKYTVNKAAIDNSHKDNKASIRNKHKKEEESKSVKAFKEKETVEKKSIRVNLSEKKDGFLKSIQDRNNNINERIENMKTNDFSRIMKMEKTKVEIAKNIVSFCKTNKDIFSQFKGMDYQLDQVLDGNVDCVLNDMEFKDVSKGIGNLIHGVAIDDLEDLKKYYASDEKDTKTFKEYRQEHGKSNKVDSDKLTDKQKNTIDALKQLGGLYKLLFEIDGKIKSYKKECAERYDKLDTEMHKVGRGGKNKFHSILDSVTEEAHKKNEDN